MAIAFFNGELKGEKFESTGQFLQTYIHPTIGKKFLRQSEIIRDNEQAAYLEKILREVKTYILNARDNTVSEEPRAFIRLLASNLIDNLPPDLQGRNIFNYSGLNKNDLGLQFEQEIATIFFNAINQVNKNITATDLTTGKLQATSDLTFTGAEKEKIVRDVLKTLNKDISSSFAIVSDRMKKKAPKDQLFRLTARSGKTDIDVPSLTIEGTSNPELEKFLNILSNSSFTLKNYNKAEIELGETDPFKIYMSVLSYVKPRMSKANKIKIFYASLNKGVKDQEIKKLHDYHIRFFYELVGPGLVDRETGVKLNQCKFLIVNQQNGPNIRVISTKQLVYNFFNNPRLKGHDSYKYEISYTGFDFEGQY